MGGRAVGREVSSSSSSSNSSDDERYIKLCECIFVYDFIPPPPPSF